MLRQSISGKGLLVAAFLTLFVGWPNQVGLSKGQTAEQIPTSAGEVHPLLIGAKVPNLTLTAADGSRFDLNAAILKKPTVLIFYRGGW